MENRRKKGQIYEKKAARFLEKHGYEILAVNFYSKFGEIDIIAKKENLLVIIEVKYRETNLYGEGIESINKVKLKRIFKTTRQYIYEHNIKNMDIRFDCICFFKDTISWFTNVVWGDEIGF